MIWRTIDQISSNFFVAPGNPFNGKGPVSWRNSAKEDGAKGKTRTIAKFLSSATTASRASGPSISSAIKRKTFTNTVVQIGEYNRRKTERKMVYCRADSPRLLQPHVLPIRGSCNRRTNEFPVR